MILEYGAKNFCCFKEWVTIDLSLNGDVPKDISNGLNYVSAMCFKGANASGKTNALKILAFLADFCKNSFSYSPNTLIMFNSFFDNTEFSDFFIRFKIDATEYLYELTATRSQVIREAISVIRDSKENLIFERNQNSLDTNLIFENKVSAMLQGEQSVLRSNASIISTLYGLSVKEINPFIQFFSNITANVSYTGLNIGFAKMFDSNRWYFDNPDYLNKVTGKIRKFDTGIEKIEIKKIPAGEKGFIYYPMFFHNASDGLKELSFDFQSSGTQWLYKNLMFFIYSLLNGGILIIDEIDLNLHSKIIPELIRDFLSPETNKKNAQLIFTTHNDEIMEFTKKYGTCLFNKEKSESYCYRLDELPENIMKNDRPIVPLYKKGLLGGVPKIEQ